MPLHITSTPHDGRRSKTWTIDPPESWPSFGQAAEQLLATQVHRPEQKNPSLKPILEEPDGFASSSSLSPLPPLAPLEPNMNPHLSRHRRFYMRAGNLHFLVGRIIFRVHRHFFVSESSYFQELLSTPPGGYPKGCDDSSAIILDDVLPEEFACFLSVFYDPQYKLTSGEDWLLILELACHWHFPEVKKTAIRALSTLRVPEVDRIVAFEALKLNRAYLFPLYAALVARENPLSAEEGEKLGMPTAIRIAQLRETARTNAARTVALKRASRPDSAVQSIIHETFNLSGGQAVGVC